ncbi:MAG: PRTRC system ParB family protein, partial [Rhizobium sp.]
MQSTQVRHGGLELPIAAIAPQEGFNPRRHFDPAALDRLAASIKAQGVVQAITVRPRSDGAEGYWIVAGERRWRSAKAAGLTVIPAVVRDYDDATALAVASVENEHRENISAAEEARIARRAVDAANGDVDESARMLGWTPAKVNARLLLLHAIDEVLDAVASKTILLGHAELLSTLPPDVQRRVLPNVISNKATVETLRSQLAQFTQELAHAPFETEGCRGCPNNSAVQSSLFEFHVGSGRCSNKPCWDSKRSEALDAKKAQVATEVNVVFFDKEKDPATYTRLEALGPRGVGEPQMQSGCKGCAKFGAVVSTAPGKEGRVAGGLCFDLGCHAAKVAEYQATLPPPPASNGEAEGAV